MLSLLWAHRDRCTVTPDGLVAAWDAPSAGDTGIMPCLPDLHDLPAVHVPGPAGNRLVVPKRGGFAVEYLVPTNKQVHVDPHLLMVVDHAAVFTLLLRAILTLPLELASR